MFKLPTLYVLLAAFAIAGLAAGWFYEAGGRAERTGQLEDSLGAEKDRKNVDRKIQSNGDHALCLRFSRVPNDCDELLGVDTAPRSE